MTYQDRGPPKKEAAEVAPSGQFCVSLPKKKVTKDCPKTLKKSSTSDNPHDRFIRALRGALASAETALWPGVTLVAMARLALRERMALAFSALRAIPPDERVTWVPVRLIPWARS